jgi:hypothetical protein
MDMDKAQNSELHRLTPVMKSLILQADEESNIGIWPWHMESARKLQVRGFLTITKADKNTGYGAVAKLTGAGKEAVGRIK